MFDSELCLPSALASAIENAAAMPAFLDGTRTNTWGEVGERIQRLAAGLHDLGIRQGTRVAIVARTTFRAEEIKWAILWLGAVAVPLNWRYSGAELQHALTDSEPSLIVADEASSELLREVKREFLILGKDTEQLIAGSQPRPADLCDERSDAMLFYTGGTTGRSKGVRLTHRNIYLNALQIASCLRPLRSDVYLHAAPNFHTVSLLATCFLMRGSSNAYLPAFDPGGVLDAIERYRVTVMTAVPTMVIQMVRDPSFEGRDLSSLRLLLFGGEAFSADWIAHLDRVLPNVDLVHGYGLTETSPNISLLEPELVRDAMHGRRGKEILRACGKPHMGASVRIVDDEGHELPSGEAGEVLFRGPGLMASYLNLPVETAAAIRDGWLHTGDIGKLDAEGNLYILDRLKDMIITGGENVYSVEVERALTSHEDVVEAAVFGLPDPTYGEMVTAAVMIKSGASADADSLQEHCRALIARYKAPRRIEVVADFPRTPIGKVNKKALRNAYLKEDR